MSTNDVRTLIALGIAPTLAETLNSLISQQQDIDFLKGITFNTDSGTPFTIHTVTGPSTDVPPIYYESLIFGYNIATGTPGIATFPVGDPPNPVKVTAGKPCFRHAIETNWHQIGSGTSDQMQLEWNADYVSPSGTFSERCFYWRADMERDTTAMYINVQQFDLYCPVWTNKTYSTGASTYISCDHGAFEAVTLCAGLGLTPLAAYGTPKLRLQGSAYMQNDNCNIHLDCYGAAADSRVWTIRGLSTGTYFAISAFNDAGSVATDAIKITRSGTTITHLAFPNGISTRANNAAALAAGLVAGDLYKTGGDPDLLCIVH